MRAQTKSMLRLLEKHTVVSDSQATKAGITNPRREAGLLMRREGAPVSITEQSDTKREYRLLTA